MPFEPLESKRMYQRAEAIADRIWEIVQQWKWFAQRTVGLQWVDAGDSSGANIAEAGGRFYPNDVRTFLFFARWSLRETKYWLRRAQKRALISEQEQKSIDDELEQLSREINEAVRYQKTRANRK